MTQPTMPTSSSSSLADAVASADSTLAELEAFLRRTDSQAHIRVADDSSSSSLCFHGSAACVSRLGGGAEDELRRELERISNVDSAADGCRRDDEWRGGKSVVRGQWSSRSSSAVDLFGAASTDDNDEQEDSSVLSDDDDELPLDRSSFFYYSDDDDDSVASPIGTDVSFDSSSSSCCSSSRFSEETSLGTDNEEEEEESSFENEEPPSCVADTPEQEATAMTVKAAGRPSNSESQKKRTTFNLSVFLFRWTQDLAEVLFGSSKRQ